MSEVPLYLEFSKREAGGGRAIGERERDAVRLLASRPSISKPKMINPS